MPPPSVPELKEFEEKLLEMLKDIKFGRKVNHFQQQMTQDKMTIKNEARAIIKADKSTTYYMMDFDK